MNMEMRQMVYIDGCCMTEGEQKMEMDVRRLAETYYAQRDRLLGLYSRVLATLKDARRPDAQMLERLAQSQCALNETYDTLQRFAAENLTAEEMPAENAPVHDLCLAISSSAHMRGVRVLKALLAMRAAPGAAAFSEELHQAQTVAQILLDAHDRGEKVQWDTSAWEIFIRAAAMGPELRRDAQMLRALETPALPLRLVLGLFAGAYEADAGALEAPAVPFVQADMPDMIGDAAFGAAPARAAEPPAAALEEVAPAPEPLWPESRSYLPEEAGHAGVQRGKSSSSLTLQHFRAFLSKHPDEANTLVKIANTVLFDPETITDADRQRIVLDPEWQPFKHGYVDRVVVERDGDAKVYFCLSDMSLGFLRQRDVQQFLHPKRNPIVHYPIRAQHYVPSSLMTEAGVYGLLQMMAYTEKHSGFAPLLENMVFTGSDWSPVRGQKRGLMAAFFTVGEEERAVAWMRSAINRAAAEGVQLTILAANAEEAAHMHDVLALSAAEAKCVSYASVADPDAPEICFAVEDAPADAEPAESEYTAEPPAAEPAEPESTAEPAAAEPAEPECTDEPAEPEWTDEPEADEPAEPESTDEPEADEPAEPESTAEPAVAEPAELTSENEPAQEAEAEDDVQDASETVGEAVPEAKAEPEGKKPTEKERRQELEERQKRISRETEKNMFNMASFSRIPVAMTGELEAFLASKNAGMQPESMNPWRK